MIEPRYATLQTLFADRVFRIPRYQRFYSWGAKQREDLFSDLRKLAERGNDNHHFMATIVCHRTSKINSIGAKEYRLYDVVDGQQRLTTLILILKCIELALEDGSEERTELAKTIVKRDGILILLQTNNANEHIFNAFLREGRSPSSNDIQTDADIKLADGIQECATFVKDWAEKRGDAMSLLKLVQNKLGFVVYDTEDNRVVYSIFEVLNSRGLAVDWLDKCKSILMGKAFEFAGSTDAEESMIQTLQNLWGNIYREIANVSVSGQEILRITATLYYAPIQSRAMQADEALECLREKCTDADKPRQIAEKIYDVAKRLVALEKNIFLGPVTKILQARVLAVALESAQYITENEREKALKQWERTTFRIFGLFRKDSRTKVGDFIRLACRITSGADGMSRYSQIMKELRELGSDYPIEQAAKEGLDCKNCYEDTDICRFILWRYEEHLARAAGRGGTVDEHVRRDVWNLRAGDSIEHIFPQNPEPGGAWENMMRRGDGEGEEHLKHVNRIGNLILLPIGLNLEARRSGFGLKKDIYNRHNLRMIREVTTRQDGTVRLNWTLAEIEQRERNIIEWAKGEWNDLNAE